MRPDLGSTVALEKLEANHGFSRDTLNLLQGMGYTFEAQEATMGSTQSIMREGNHLYGAADPRRPGAEAIGY